MSIHGKWSIDSPFLIPNFLEMVSLLWESQIMFIWNKYKNQVLGQSNVADIDLTPIVCSCIFCSYCSISYIFSKVLQLNILSILMPLHALLCLAILGLDIGLLQSLHWTLGRAVALWDKKSQISLNICTARIGCIKYKTLLFHQCHPWLGLESPLLYNFDSKCVVEGCVCIVIFHTQDK